MTFSLIQSLKGGEEEKNMKEKTSVYSYSRFADSKIGVLFSRRYGWLGGGNRYGIYRGQHDGRVRHRCVNWRGKLHYDGHRIERHRRINRLQNGT